MMHWIGRIPAVSVCLLVLAAASAASAAGDKKTPRRLIDVAQPTTRPAGSPAYSDVCFSSRWVHPSGKGDPHDSLKMIDAFHATRLEWAYISDKAFIKQIKQRGLTFCPATNSSAFVGDLRKIQPRGRILDLKGNIITAPWMRMWKHSSWGCVNSPDYRASYLTKLKSMADLGADSIQTDDPGNNWTATHWGGCFCEHCMKGFTAYLENHLTAAAAKALGIENLEDFDYAVHLQAQKAPSGDAFGPWDGGRLKEHFIAFQKASVEAFYRDMWAGLKAHAGRHIPVSSNNSGGRWGFPYDLFDYGMAELGHHDARPARIRALLQEAGRRGKAQIFTFVSTDVNETRRVIAACYANGGHLIVPWDVYLKSTPEGSERYFGKPEEYADLYGFVRKHAKYFDGYEDAAVFGPELKDDRYETPPVSIGGSDQVAAFARAQPRRSDAPVVIHLLNLSDKPQSFALNWDERAVALGRSVRAELLMPGRDPRPLEVDREQDRAAVNLEDLELWAMVILRAG